MSGDFGPRVTLPAVLRALQSHPKLHLRLTGDGAQIESYLSTNSAARELADRISITHATRVLAADTKPRDALRGKQDSSLHSCLELLADGQVEGVVSAGSTAALVAIGRRRISMLPGFSRPALCSAMPAREGVTYMLDLGANVDAAPRDLHEFALMGTALVAALHDSAAPRVALLSNGVEPSKGNVVTREAAERLQLDPRVNYIGYIEGSDIYSGTAELIVCDGMLGNVALKSAEGTADFAAFMVGRSFSKHWWSRLLGVAAAPVLRGLKNELSADRHGGAFLLGLQGIVVKSHGASSVDAFAAAVEQAARCLEQDMVPSLAKIIENHEMTQE